MPTQTCSKECSPCFRFKDVQDLFPLEMTKNGKHTSASLRFQIRAMARTNPALFATLSPVLTTHETLKLSSLARTSITGTKPISRQEIDGKFMYDGLCIPDTLRAQPCGVRSLARQNPNRTAGRKPSRRSNLTSKGSSDNPGMGVSPVGARSD